MFFLMGFVMVGWIPLDSFEAVTTWALARYLLRSVVGVDSEWILKTKFPDFEDFRIFL